LAASVVDSLLVSAATLPLALAAGWAGLAAGFLAAIVYFGSLEGGPRGQTIGKRALRIRVVDLEGGAQLGFRRACLRHLCRVVSSLPCFLGYAWVLWSRERQTWHDLLSGAVVVEAAAERSLSRSRADRSRAPRARGGR
jgi:uncharacterized RDD family membrane protein YckC